MSKSLIKTKNGSALITALFIMTLVAIVATAMSSRLQIDIYRTRLTQNSDRLSLASQAVAFWAIDRLMDADQALVGLDQSGKILDFPSKLQTIYPGAVITGQLYDLQAKFNLNNVTNATYLPVFFGLLKQTLPDLNQQEHKLILDATINWIIGSTAASTGHDEWFDRYSKQKPVYFPGYQLMQNISEFRTVFGIHALLYQALLPNITVLPEVTPINLNTAPLVLLMSLGDGLKKNDANEIIKIRHKKEIKNMSEFDPLLDRFNIPKTEITLSSTYFLSIATATIDGVTLKNYTILKRAKDKAGKLSVNILNESFNTP
ncbi:MAG: type II secretion system minor pseudopilin GspK [Legionellaceae bacterium]|nr:type II secretion system minor pseudopilin GspK [Legionellaceae bacterium]